MMIHAANVAVAYHPRMKGFYERRWKRHAGKHAIAITPVANKMIRMAWKMFQTSTAYSSHNEDLYRRKLSRHAERSQRRSGTISSARCKLYGD